MSTLYDIAERYNNIVELMDDETIPAEAVTEALDGIEDELEEKCCNWIAILRQQKSYVESCKKEADRFAGMAKAAQNKLDSMKSYCMASLITAGQKKISTKYGNMAIRKNGGQQPLKVDIDQLPDEYKTSKVVYQYDSKQLYKELQAGKEIAGCHLEERGQYLAF